MKLHKQYVVCINRQLDAIAEMLELVDGYRDKNSLVYEAQICLAQAATYLKEEVDPTDSQAPSPDGKA